jgi:hypothetical protein
MGTMEILTGALVAITAVYAYLTHRMTKAAEASVRLMKEQADAISRPYVVVSMVKQPNNPFIHLRVENTGKTAAENLTLSLGPEFEQIKELDGMKRLCGSHLFTKTTASFPPQSPVFFLLGFGSSLQGANDKKYPQDTFTVTAKYSFAGRTVCEATTIDVNQYAASMLETDPLVDALNKIKEEIGKIK